MKLLTLNIHSRPETDARVMRLLAARIVSEGIDVVALQEINQSMAAPVIRQSIPGRCPLPDDAPSLPIKQDNALLTLTDELRKQGCAYYWAWLPVKCGYDCYDEGLALLTRRPPRTFTAPWLSECRDAGNWRTRRALGVLCENRWFYTVHMGRWDDEKEPFARQWERLRRHCASHGGQTFLMGDFNCPADARRGGYDRMLADDYYDTFAMADSRHGSATAAGGIDGWHDGRPAAPLRIDLILSNQPCRVLSSRTLFDGCDGERISDHCAVLAELADGGGVAGA